MSTKLWADPTLELSVPDPALWWTWDTGPQNLYRASISVGGDEMSTDFGIRVLERDSETLEYRLNGVRLFLRGVWFPMTTLFMAGDRGPEVRRDIDMLIDANANHLVVYTVIEDPELYVSATRRGLLVFQELPFAQLGPMRVLEPDYPRHEEWVTWALQSVRSIVRQLRGHTSVVLWAAFAETRKDGVWQYGDYEDFARALAEVVSNEDLDAMFHPSFCDFGEDHFWEGGFPEGEFWDQADFNAKFVSEYGSIAPPVVQTISTFLPPERQWDQPSGELGRLGLPVDVEELSYQWSFDYPGLTNSVARLFRWVDREVPTFDRFVDGLQWYQAQGIEYCATTYRSKRFADIAGCRIWCYRDFIPGVRFGVVDHLQRPKMGYFALRRAYSPVLLAHIEPRPLSPVLAGEPLQINTLVVNDTQQERYLTVRTEVRDSAGTLVEATHVSARVGADDSVPIDIALREPLSSGLSLLRSRAYDADGIIVSVAERWKYAAPRVLPGSTTRVLMFGQSRYSAPFSESLRDVPGVEVTLIDETTRTQRDSNWAQELTGRYDAIWFTGWDELNRRVRQSELSLIAESVYAGVGFIHTGGQGSLHGGDGRGAMLDVTPLGKVLPVELGPHEAVWDYIPDAHDLLHDDLGRIFGSFDPTMYHRTSPRAGSTVHASIGGHPLVVSGAWGAGKTVVVAAGFVPPIRKFALEFVDPEAFQPPWERASLRNHSRYWRGCLPAALALLAHVRGLEPLFNVEEYADDLQMPLFERLARLPQTSLEVSLERVEVSPSGGVKGAVRIVNGGPVVARLVRGEVVRADVGRFLDGFVDLLPDEDASLRFEAPGSSETFEVSVAGQNTETVCLRVEISR